MSAIPSNPQFTMRNAVSTDLPRILALLPLLADFDIPEKRRAEDLWSADAKLAADILSDRAASAFIDVAEDSNGDIAGVIMVSLCEELLSHAPKCAPGSHRSLAKCSWSGFRQTSYAAL